MERSLRGGYSSDGSGTAFAIARYNTDGTLDTTFGTSGSVRNYISGGSGTSDIATSIAIQSDGKIVAGGYSYDGSGTAFAIARYNTDGTLDPTFGTNGSVRNYISGGGGDDDDAYSIAIQSDGKIVAGGYSDDGSYNSYAFAIARYDTDGTLDTTFGTSGSVRNYISGGGSTYDEAYSIAIQSDGKIVAGGYSLDSSGNCAFAVARYNTDGTLDNTFGTGSGSVRNYISGGGGNDDKAYSIAIQSDGKIVAGGYSDYQLGWTAFAISRYDTDGTLDPTFGTSGSVLNHIEGGGGNDDKAMSIAIQSDGKIVAGGASADASSNYVFAIARDNTDGTPDNTFGAGGSVSNFISGGDSSYAVANSIAIQSDGKIVAGGCSKDASNHYAFAVARYYSMPAADASVAVNVTQTTATLQGMVFPNSISATVQFLYGTTSGVYSDSVSGSPSTVDGNTATSVSASLTGLANGTTYYYRVSGTSSSPANYFVSTEQSFTSISSSAGNTLLFDGANDYVDVPYAAVLNPSGDFTVEFWARCDGNDGTRREPLSSINGSFNGYTFMAFSDNTWLFACNGSALYGPAIQDGQWAHLAAVHDGTANTFTFYVNGTAYGPADASGYVANTSVDFFLGEDQNLGNNSWFKGALDEVRVWNVARTQAEIQATMNTALNGDETGLVAYWQLNESGTNTTAHDWVGDNNGTLNNFNFDATDGWISSDSPLPVELTSLTATLLNSSNAELKWTTATEVENAGWEVERRLMVNGSGKMEDGNKSNHPSIQQSTWFKVGFISGSGTSNAPKEYSFTDAKLSGGCYAYRLKQINRDGTYKYSQEVEVAIEVPRVFSLSQNYPNPFNPSTTIGFTLPDDGKVMLKIYDVLGREVKTLVNEEMKAGEYHQVVFDGTSLASGMYFARLQFSGKQLIKKMLMTK